MAFDKNMWVKRSQKIGVLLFWSSLLALLLGGVSFVNKEASHTLCSEVIVKINNNEEYALVDRKMVLQTASSIAHDSFFVGKPISQLDLLTLEQRLNTNMLIKQAHVFTDLNGRLFFEVTQRQPILRVVNINNQQFYIDKEGLKMPLSPVFTAHVPVASGYITEAMERSDSVETHLLKGLVKIATYVDKDAFWKAQIEQIFVNEEAEIILVPKLGNHKVLFGNTHNLELKFEKLLIFYREGLNRVGWNKYQTIDLRFENQVVAKKK
jgi:cell division protein FtsQ